MAKASLTASGYDDTAIFQEAVDDLTLVSGVAGMRGGHLDIDGEFMIGSINLTSRSGLIIQGTGPSGTDPARFTPNTFL